MKSDSRLPRCCHPVGTKKFVHGFLVGCATFRAFAVVLGCTGLLTVRAVAAETADTFEITLRSSVERQFTLFGKKPAAEHSKLYAIGGIRAAYLMPHDTSRPLAIPVNEDNLRAQLKNALSARGFHEITWGKTADIILTVIYGRNQLRNPYADRTIEVDGGAIGLPGAKVVDSTSSSDQIGREKSDPAYYRKLQTADAEKLFIIISAWQNPAFHPAEKEKPILLWRTTVFIDDPDRDLNAISEKMLAAAGAYFDRQIDKEEVSVMSNIADGKVDVGTPTEVEQPKPGA